MELFFTIVIIALLAIAVIVYVAGKKKSATNVTIGDDVQPNVEKEIQKLQSLIKSESNISQILSQLDRILDIDPQNIDALSTKGRCLYLKSVENDDKKMYDEALVYYDKALALSPLNPSIVLGKAQILAADEKHTSQSIEYFDKAIELQPDSVHAWRGKAQALASMGKDHFEQAKKCYDSMLAIFTNKAGSETLLHEKIELMLKHMQESADHLDETIKDLEALEKAFPNNPEIWFNKGLAYHYAGESHFEQALQYYDKAIDSEEGQDSVWTNKGALYLSLKDYEKALECFENAIEINEESPLAWNNISIAYEAIGNNVKASDCIKKASSIDPKGEYSLETKQIRLESSWVNDPFKYAE